MSRSSPERSAEFAPPIPGTGSQPRNARADSGSPSLGVTKGRSRTKALPGGLIFSVALAAGTAVPPGGEKRPIRCPFHDDENPSAFLSIANIFYCSVCTPNGGWPAKRFAEALGVRWPLDDWRPAPVRSHPCRQEEHDFTASMASAVWRSALERARDDHVVDADRDVYEYLNRRGLGLSWEACAFGVLADGMQLPRAVRWWPDSGYRIVAPLFDGRGQLSCIQARAVGADGSAPKTRFPAGSAAAGTAFATASGLAVLRGTQSPPSTVILGEGLTDHLALTISSPVPVLSAPGTGMARHVVGNWAAGRSVLLALDWDSAGDRAVEVVAQRVYEAGGHQACRIQWPDRANDACDVIETRGADGLAAFLDHLIGGLQS